MDKFTSVDLGGGVNTLKLTTTSTGLNGLSDAKLLGVTNVSAVGAASSVVINLGNQSEGFTITGSDNDDTITGGKGADIITGGLGADTFNFTTSHSLGTVGGTGDAGTIGGYDTVTDFFSSTDFIDLQGAAFAVANTATFNGNDSTLTIMRSDHQVACHFQWHHHV